MPVPVQTGSCISSSVIVQKNEGRAPVASPAAAIF